jgi:hypothetical protein
MSSKIYIDIDIDIGLFAAEILSTPSSTAFDQSDSIHQVSP